jgi:hypothetical protein
MSERDLLNWALAIAAAEENARLTAERLASKIQVEVKAPSTTTRVVKRVDVKLPETLVDELGCGCLEELVVKSLSKEYVLRVYVDDVELYNNSFSWFQEISQEAEEIEAFEEDGVYVLRLSNIKFARRLRVAAEPSTSAQPAAKLETVFCKISLAFK